MTTKRKSRAKLAIVDALPEGSIAMKPEDIEAARVQLILIMHHREIIARLEAELVEKLETGYGANVRAGGTHSLNVAEGRLDRIAV